MDPRVNQRMVNAMREPELIREQVMRNDGYSAKHIRYRAPVAAYSLLQVSNHPLITMGPGEHPSHDPASGTYFSYTPVAVLLALSGFKVDVVDMQAHQTIGHIEVAPMCNVLVYENGDWASIEAVME